MLFLLVAQKVQLYNEMSTRKFFTVNKFLLSHLFAKKKKHY